MPEDTRRYKPPYSDKSVWPVLVAIAVLLVVAYAVFSDSPDSREQSRTSALDGREVYPLPSAGSLPLITEIPTLYSSEVVSGKAEVADTVGERGLWLADDEHQRRVFAILSESASEFSLKVGQSVQIEGQAYRREGLHKISSGQIDLPALNTLREQKVFIYIESLHLAASP